MYLWNYIALNEVSKQGASTLARLTIAVPKAIFQAQ
jgi:hypothetical protein